MHSRWPATGLRGNAYLLTRYFDLWQRSQVLDSVLKLRRRWR